MEMASFYIAEHFENCRWSLERIGAPKLTRLVVIVIHGFHRLSHGLLLGVADWLGVASGSNTPGTDEL